MASQITTHVLDTSLGRPATGIEVCLYREDESTPLGTVSTDADGRAVDFYGGRLSGVCRLSFDTGSYFLAQGRDAFFPRVEIAFHVNADEHYHVPLLVSPFGYSTYRGS